MIAIDCNGLSLLIFEEKWPNYASVPKSAPNSDSFWVRRLFNVCVRVFCDPKCDNFDCLHTCQDQNEPSPENTIFFAKQILQHYHDFQSNTAIFPSGVQAYTQPYLFGGRIELIICQIRHELSVTIQEISTSWKKVRWRTQYIHNEIIGQYNPLVRFMT